MTEYREVPIDIETSEQNYVRCLYDNEPWIGLVAVISDEHGDNSIEFMHPHGPAMLFHWPRDEDLCWLDKKSILMSSTNFPLGCTASASLTMLKYLDYVKSGNVNFSSIITANIVNSLLLH